MLAHSGMLDAVETSIDNDKCKQDPDRAWEDWKEHESKHRSVLPQPAADLSYADFEGLRLAHSWVIVDQEMSLFSDTTPLLSVVNLHAAMPDSDDLWHAETVS